MRFISLLILFFFCLQAKSQYWNHPQSSRWADSVYQTLNEDERIGQLMTARLSSMDVKTRKVTYLFDQVMDYVKKYNIGSICIFQGDVATQINQINQLKKAAKTPILFTIDGEWGVAMRLFDSVMTLPRQMMLGAVGRTSLIRYYGKTVADQCKRLGIQMNYAPVVDINNNPDNPVINDRSFGENKYKVAEYGVAYMQGMQDNGVMACAKHFPGHGDVSVDSHLDLPSIYKSKEQLDTLELYPFKQMFHAGVSSVMIGHLHIPAIDTASNRPTSLSVPNVKGLLKDSLQYEGLAITDGLEMQGVKKFFPNGEASVEALIAGNELLCLPDSIPLVIEKVKTAIANGKLSWEDIGEKCKKVLRMKYEQVIPMNDSISIDHVINDLNKNSLALRRDIAHDAITVLSLKNNDMMPFQIKQHEKIAYVGLGISKPNLFCRTLQNKFHADSFFVPLTRKNRDSLQILSDSITRNYSRVIIGIHQINRTPANNFGISNELVNFIHDLEKRSPSILFHFGNAYAAKNWCEANNLVICYEDDSITQQEAIRKLVGASPCIGSLPVSICSNYPFGSGINMQAQEITSIKQYSKTEYQINIDTIIHEVIAKKAMPGCVVYAVKNGKTIFEKAFGYRDDGNKQQMKVTDIFDLASLTKILSTTLAVMKLYDEKKIDLDSSLGKYLPSVRGSNKEKIILKNLLLHQAGLEPYIPFYKELLDSHHLPQKKYFSKKKQKNKSIEVAEHLYMNASLIDSFYKRILQSPVNQENKYLYSDNDFILLGKMAEAVSGMKLNEYVNSHFYQPMGLHTIGYHPLQKHKKNEIVASAKETDFRNQILQGYVHDPGAALMGGVAGHAGLFSDAHDIACIMQMLLNQGDWKGSRYLNAATVDLFTSAQSSISRRGLGFDKTESDNDKRAEPYPASCASWQTFGHTGFTGTSIWADPSQDLIVVFLSNRLYPADNGVFKTTNVRSRVFDVISRATRN